MKKIVTVCLFSLLLILSVSCQTAPETPSPTAPVPLTPFEVTDQLGRTVIIEPDPQKIISLAPSNTEILFALGLGERVVGVTEYCNYPPEAREKPTVGGFSTPNIEEIVALEPDLVLAVSRHEDEIIPQLEDKGLTVVALAPETIDDVLVAITLVGQVTGAVEEAAALRADMEARIKAITHKTGSLSEDEKTRTFYVVWHDPLMTAGTTTFHDQLITLAGGTNIAHDLSGYADISLEAVLVANPEVMLAGVGMGTGADLPLQFLLEDESRLEDTDARKNGRIFPIDTDIVGRAGPRIVEALEQLALFLHPELFE